MECYATPWRLWRERRILYFFTEPSYPENLPSLFICRDFFSFCPFNHGLARLQAQGLALVSANGLVACRYHPSAALRAANQWHNLKRSLKLVKCVSKLSILKPNSCKLAPYLMSSYSHMLVPYLMSSNSHMLAPYLMSS